MLGVRQIGLARIFSSGMLSCLIACSNFTQSFGLMTGITTSAVVAPAACSGMVRSACRRHRTRS